MCETLMEFIFGMWVPYGEYEKPIDICFFCFFDLLIFVEIQGHMMSTEVKNCNLQL